MIIVIRKSLISLIYSVLILLLLTLILPYIVPPPQANPKSTTILLDPGHGGWDGGTHDYNGLVEKNIVLELAFYLKEELEKYSFSVQMTRTTDRELSEFAPYQGTRQRTDLLARANMVQKYQADLLVSLHVNAAGKSSFQGAIAFYKPGSTPSKGLAAAIQDALLELQPYNQQTILPGNFYLLRKSTVPSILLEIAFITNPVEHDHLQNPQYLQQMAIIIAKTISHYISTSQD